MKKSSKEGLLYIRKAIILFVCVLFLLGACSKENNVADEVSALLEVSINIQEVVIEAAVTQGQEKVEGANEVKFEVKKAGQDTSEEMIGEHQGKGVYSITTTFKRWGPIR